MAMELRSPLKILYLLSCAFVQWRLINTCRAEISKARYISERQYNHHEINLDDSRHGEEFFTFITRPDIDAPRWDIEILDEEAIAPGHWFSAPYSDVHQLESDGPWNGPAIYDGGGELIWSGAPIFDGWSTFDFRVINVQGKPMLSVISRHKGTATIFDETYQIHKTVEMGDNNKELREDVPALNMHEFTTVNGGRNALYITRVLRKVSAETTKSVGFDSGCYVIFDTIMELDTRTWEITNKWSSEGHIGLDESYAAKDPLSKCTLDAPWDYFHANSIDRFPNGDYLVSGRRTYAIYRVAHDTGAIIWRLGGRKSDFEMSIKFSGQHSAKILDTNETHTTLSFLDNAYFQMGDPQMSNDMSRGLLVQLDTTTMTAQLLTEYPHPYDAFAMGRGNMQMLPNGNAWLCWVSNPLQSEHAPDGSLVLKANFKANIASYRSFKYSWIGRPSDPPDVHAAIVRKDGQWYTIVHMSWNGATEVQEWKVYHTTGDGWETNLVAKVPRKGFETSTWTKGRGSHVFVEALDKDGKVLGKSAIVASLPPRNSETLGTSRPTWLDSVVRDSRWSFILGITLGLLVGSLARYGWKWLRSLRSGSDLSWRKQNPQAYKPLLKEDEEVQMELRGCNNEGDETMSDSQSIGSP